MRILVATDAWKPQVNGVVRSLESVARAVREFGAEIEFLTPQAFASVPLPTYGEIRLALASPALDHGKRRHSFCHSITWSNSARYSLFCVKR
jgi:hypothetical protein